MTEDIVESLERRLAKTATSTEPWSQQVHDAVETAEDAIAALKAALQVRAAGCQCGDNEACRFVREREEALAKLALAHEAFGGEPGAHQELAEALDMQESPYEAIDRLARERNSLRKALHGAWVKTAYGPKGNRAYPMMVWRCDGCGGTSPEETPFKDMPPASTCQHEADCPLKRPEPEESP